MSFGKKLQSPIAMVGQGFLVGGLIFFATHNDPLDGARAAAPAAPAAPITVQPMA